MNIKLISVLAAGLLSGAPAFSSTVFLDFEGVTSDASIAEFYNGGSDGEGVAGPGNLGISFGLGALGLSNSIPDFPVYSGAPSPGTVMQIVGTDSALNAQTGFEGQVSFWYSAAADTSVSIWSGLDGAGSAQTFTLLANAQTGCEGSDIPFCNWNSVTLDFSGTAHSILFGEGAGFDDVTISTVPLPAAAWLLLSGLGGLGVFSRRKQAA